MFKRLVRPTLNGLRRAADQARDCRDWTEAARLYEQILAREPGNAAIHIQCGHMLKEKGDLARAEYHYNQASRLTPDDPDLALQLGHFYKVAGRLHEAEAAYCRAMALDPDWTEPAVELGRLYRAGWRNRTKVLAQDGPHLIPSDRPALSINDPTVPEIAPHPPESLRYHHHDSVTITWLGKLEQTYWGNLSTVRGVDAIRGFCISGTPIVEFRAVLNGLRFYTGPLTENPVKYEKFDTNKRKYAFNIWHDFSQFAEGTYDLQLQFVGNNGALLTFDRQIAVGTPLAEEDFPNSDRIISLSASDERSLEEQINSRPSMIRLAKRARFDTPPKNVLVLRVDQLGDMVVSLPALRRLRQLLPNARLVGLLSPSNIDLANTFGLFDETIPLDFPEDEWERRRIMPLDKQHELRRQLEPYRFDVAIDLSVSDMSRPLLLLTGAPYLFGFKDDRFPWLSATFEARTRDPLNHYNDVPYSTQILALIEWFGTILGSHAQIVRRDDLSRDRLKAYGLSETDRFAVLHTGARLKFSRWPHYHELANMLLDRTDLKIVMMSDDPRNQIELPAKLSQSNRFLFIDRRMPFDDLDAMLSFCTVFVGNDSGPGHLASLCGANVISLYIPRHNWNEWGHENHGYIITRRVPCAGCHIYYDPDECARDFPCITNITPHEVFDTILKLL